MENENQANPSAEPTATTFAERKQQQLRQERESRQPEQQNVEPPAPEDEYSADERQPDEVEAEESEQDHTEADDTEGALQDEAGTDDVEWTARETELTEARDKAEESRKSMERDYRQKTHKLSESVREVEAQAEEVAGAAQYMAAVADQQVAQFEHTDWAELRTRPEEYQAAQQQYMRATQMQEQRHRELESIKQRTNEIKQKNLDRIAEHSRGVLQHQIPNWGNETYGKIREFAQTNYDYSEEDFNQIVDWRQMKALHDAMQADQVKQSSAKVIKKTGKRRGKPSGRNAPTTQLRNAKGQYESAKKEVEARPGDREAFRAMKYAQLQMERQGRR